MVGNGPAAPGLLSAAAGSRRVVLAVICLLLLPAVLPRTPRGMTGAAALGVGAIVFWALVTVTLFLIGWSNGQLHHITWWPPSSSAFVGQGFESAVQASGCWPGVAATRLPASTC